MSHKMKKRELI